MRRISKFLVLASFGHLLGFVQGNTTAVKASGTPPANASALILGAFVSYSIEFSSFPDFAGMWSDIRWNKY